MSVVKIKTKIVFSMNVSTSVGNYMIIQNVFSCAKIGCRVKDVASFLLLNANIMACRF